MRSRSEEWRESVLRPSQPLVGATLVLFAADHFAYQRARASVPAQAPLDWTGHLLTTIYLAWATQSLIGPNQILAALVASVVIDADHIPGYLGSDVLTGGEPRPYTHSLTPVLALSLLAAARPSWRHWASGAAFGVLSHLWRDLAEPEGVGVPLMRPITKRVFRTPARWYLGSIASLGLISLIRAGSATTRPNRPARLPVE